MTKQSLWFEWRKKYDLLIESGLLNPYFDKSMIICFILMPKKKGAKQTYFINDVELFSFRFNESKDGIIVAFRKKGIDLHLTIYRRNMSFFSHVVYSDKKTGVQKRSLNTEFPLQNFLEQIKIELGNDIIQSYAEQTKCYSFTEEFMESILGKKNEQGEQEINVENAIQAVFTEPDFSDTRNFKLIYISQLLGTYPLGFINVETEPKIILPFSKDQMIVFPENFISEILSIILKGLSIDTFVEEMSQFYSLK